LLVANVALETSPLGATPPQALAVETTPEVAERVAIKLPKQFDEASTVAQRWITAPRAGCRHIVVKIVQRPVPRGGSITKSSHRSGKTGSRYAADPFELVDLRMVFRDAMAD
jgi:hypothetical protein